MLFSGQTQLLTPAGVLPLVFEIEAGTLEEALDKFPEGVNAALEQAIEEAREMRREAASRIVVPEVGASVGPGAGPGGGPVRWRRKDQISLVYWRKVGILPLCAACPVTGFVSRPRERTQGRPFVRSFACFRTKLLRLGLRGT